MVDHVREKGKEKSNLEILQFSPGFPVGKWGNESLIN
jgi:hypothetical protein